VPQQAPKPRSNDPVGKSSARRLSARIKPVCVFFSAAIVNCKVAAGPHEFVNKASRSAMPKATTPPKRRLGRVLINRHRLATMTPITLLSHLMASRKDLRSLQR
jgi:hypothetical protein